jgi:hypothetical protein
MVLQLNDVAKFPVVLHLVRLDFPKIVTVYVALPE